MYQGKFQSGKHTERVDVVAARASSEAEAAARAAARRTAAPQTRTASAASQNRQTSAAPQNRQAPAARQTVRPAEMTVEEAPRRKGPRMGGVAFYTVYFLCIFLFFGATYFGLQWLNGWLADYEAAQPTAKSQEVFDELFGDPDWAALYRMAGVEDTAYEGVDAYVAYMEKKVGDRPLNFMETSAGLSGDKKYFVRLDDEKIASFILKGDSEYITDIPDWQLGSVELYFKREESYRIQKVDGHIAYVNGVELDDSFTVQITSSITEEYLPAGVTGIRTCIQSITGLMAPPEVTITTASGENLDVFYNEATGTFAEQVVAGGGISDTEKELALNTIEAYAAYMINASGSTQQVKKYFDIDSQAYKDIVGMHGELWMNSDRGHRFTVEEILEYTKLTDELFYVRPHVTMNTTLKDGTTRDIEVEQAMFFRIKNGSWVCYQMTNEVVSNPVGKVRLTFMNGDVALASNFYETNATEVKAPVISAPEGKVFSGWARQDKAENGSITMTVFEPDENGALHFQPGNVLEPMTLYAWFENAENGGNG